MILAATTASAQSLASRLLDAIWREPDEIERRRVYADLLQQIGEDPRGEFIALQLAEHAGQSSAASRRRSRELLAAHSREWLGPLATVLTRDAIFERGFVTAGRVSARAREHHVDSPWWSTVEALAGAPTAVVLSPTARSLRRVEMADAAGHDLLVSGQRRPRLARLALEFERPRSGWVRPYAGLSPRYQELLTEMIEPGGILPGLRELGLRFNIPIERERMTWTWLGPLGSELERVEIGVEPEQYLALDEWIEGLRDDGRKGPPAFALTQAGFCYELERDAGRGWDRLMVSGKGRGADLLEGLGSLRDCEVASVAIDEALRRRARGALARAIEGLGATGILSGDAESLS